jgi:DNA-binding NtrC family response regulator
MLHSCVGKDVILLLLDIDMPGMGRLDLLAKVKECRPALPAFMISVYGDADTVNTAWKHGASEVLAKPMDFAKLRRDIMMVQADAMRRDG